MWIMEDACVPNWVPSKLLLLEEVGCGGAWTWPVSACQS